MTSILDILNIIFWGVLTFSILIVLHEGGHFAAARLFGVKVHEFMIGLPGPAIRLKTKSTTYGISVFPLGGYVRIAGMEPGPEDQLLGEALNAVHVAGRADAASLSRVLGIDRDRASALLFTLADWAALEPAPDDDVSYLPVGLHSGTLDAQEILARARRVTYRGLSTSRRIGVLAAGVGVNLAAALLIFTVVLSVWGYDAPSLTISDIQTDSPAAKAGLMTGDTILSVDDRVIHDWYDLINILAVTPPGDTGSIRYDRDGKEYTATVVYAESPATGGAFLGVTSGEISHVSLSVPQAFVESLRYTRDTAMMIAAFFNPETFAIMARNARSVVGVSVEAATVVEYGKALGYAQFIALLSLSLGMMNLLPIPPLDGGKIVVELIERLGGRQLGRRLQIGLSIAGALLLFSLIGYLMYADVLRYFVNV